METDPKLTNSGIFGFLNPGAGGTWIRNVFYALLAAAPIESAGLLKTLLAVAGQVSPLSFALIATATFWLPHLLQLLSKTNRDKPLLERTTAFSWQTGVVTLATFVVALILPGASPHLTNVLIGSLTGFHFLVNWAAPIVAAARAWYFNHYVSPNEGRTFLSRFKGMLVTKSDVFEDPLLPDAQTPVEAVKYRKIFMDKANTAFRVAA
jgi:hypothetical protein